MKIKLKNNNTRASKDIDKKKIKALTEELVDKISHYQHLIYAEKKHSVLIVFQGMDASGKDGVVKKVFSKCSAAGISVTSFKKPSDEEMAHDFLWRIHKVAPEKGQIKIFNRSHYEDILIQRVHGWIDEDRVTRRIASINAFEETLIYDNNCTIIKVMLHISPEKQLEKLLERIEDPTKNWKHNDGDWIERKLWSEYMNAYEDMMNRCSVPWSVAPVDQRWYRDYMVAKIIVDELEKLDLKLPILDEAAVKLKVGAPNHAKSESKSDDDENKDD